MIERAGELATGARVLAEGGLLLIEGPAGIGKTTVLDALLAGTERTVLRARGAELERGLAFGLVRQLFERPLAADPGLRARVLTGAAAQAAAVVDPTASASAPAAPEAVRHALTWLTANLAEEAPLVLALDDLGWSDPASLAWVLHLARRLPDLPLAVLATWRTADPLSDEDALDRLRDEPAATVVRPAPLTDAGVAALVRRRLGGAGDDVCLACARATGGNAFLVEELLRVLADRPGVDAASVRPESVARSVHRRLAQLPEAAEKAAQACAVLGDDAELRHVEAVAGLGRAAAVDGIDALAGAGILAPGRPLRFLHPLVRTAVYGRMPEQARAQAHADAARLLAAEGADDQRVATHLLAAPPAGEERWAAVLARAGTAALGRGAPAEAARLLERALEEPPPVADRPALLLELGRAEVRLQRPEGGDRLRAVADGDGPPRLRAIAVGELTARRLFLGLAPDFDRLERARAALGPEDADLSSQLAATAITAGYLLDRDGTAAATETVALARGVAGTTPAQRLLLAAHAYHLFATGAESAGTCAALAGRALEGGDIVRAFPEAGPVGMAVLVLALTGHPDAARDAIETGLAVAREQGSEGAFAVWSMTDCYRGWLVGELVEAEAAGRSALAASAALPLTAKGASGYLARVLAERGDLAGAAALVEPLVGGATLVDVLATASLAGVRLAQARLGEAADLAADVGRALAARGSADHPGVPWRLLRAGALAAQGDDAAAGALIAEQWVATERLDFPRLTALTERTQGLVERDATLLATAAERFAAAGIRLEQARTLLDLGALLRRGKQRADAREPLRAALDLADRCGATALVDRAHEELAATGAKPRRVRLSGVDALTPSELRVAHMAVEGLGNRDIAQALFVSRRTVETQLGSAYRKLDIASRDGLAAALAVSA